MSWQQVKKNCPFEVPSSLIVHNNNEPFLNWTVTCHKKWILYNKWRQPAQWLDQEEAPKHFSKPNLHQKKVIVTVWWSAASLIHYSFLNPGENHDIWEVCSANGRDALKTATPAAGTGQQNGPGSPALHPAARCEPALQKLNKLGYEVLPHPPYSPDLLPSDYHFFKHLNNFLQGTCFCNQQDAENAFQELVESRSTDFYAIGRDKLISHWQKNVLIVMVPTLIICCMNLPSYSLGFLLLTDTWVVANFGNYESQVGICGQMFMGSGHLGLAELGHGAVYVEPCKKPPNCFPSAVPPCPRPAATSQDYGCSHACRHLLR